MLDGWRVVFCCVLLSGVAGCSAVNRAVDSAAGKNLSGSGYASIQKVNTLYDTATGTPGASVFSIIGNLRYRSTIVSIPGDSRVPDTVDYTREESASIWNSSARTTTVAFSLTAGSPEAAQQRLAQLVAFDAGQHPREVSHGTGGTDDENE